MFPKSISENKSINQTPEAKMITDSFKPVNNHSDHERFQKIGEFKEYKLSEDKIKLNRQLKK